MLRLHEGCREALILVVCFHAARCLALRVFLPEGEAARKHLFLSYIFMLGVSLKDVAIYRRCIMVSFHAASSACGRRLDLGAWKEPILWAALHQCVVRRSYLGTHWTRRAWSVAWMRTRRLSCLRQRRTLRCSYRLT